MENSGDSPVSGKPPMSRWKKVALVAAVLAVPCLMAVAGGVFYVISRRYPAHDQALSNEARVNVLRLCSDVQSYRDEHGGFSSVEELDDISGIGPATMEALRSALTP